MNKKNILLMGIFGILIMTTLSACMPNPSASVGASPAGFFKGVWHGWIAPFSLIFGFFNDATRVYDPNNTGWWYDFGFYMAIISGFGGLSLARRKQEH
jgi:hypothetical protein